MGRQSRSEEESEELEVLGEDWTCLERPGGRIDKGGSYIAGSVCDEATV